VKAATRKTISRAQSVKRKAGADNVLAVDSSNDTSQAPVHKRAKPTLSAPSQNFGVVQRKGGCENVSFQAAAAEVTVQQASMDQVGADDHSDSEFDHDGQDSSSDEEPDDDDTPSQLSPVVPSVQPNAREVALAKAAAEAAAATEAAAKAEAEATAKAAAAAILTSTAKELVAVLLSVDVSTTDADVRRTIDNIHDFVTSSPHRHHALSALREVADLKKAFISLFQHLLEQQRLARMSYPFFASVCKLLMAIHFSPDSLQAFGAVEFIATALPLFTKSLFSASDSPEQDLTCYHATKLVFFGAMQLQSKCLLSICMPLLTRLTECPLIVRMGESFRCRANLFGEIFREVNWWKTTQPSNSMLEPFFRQGGLHIMLFGFMIVTHYQFVPNSCNLRSVVEELLPTYERVLEEKPELLNDPSILAIMLQSIVHIRDNEEHRLFHCSSLVTQAFAVFSTR
jgi:hypothetical protein